MGGHNSEIGSNFLNLLAFSKKANAVLRVALITAVLWPVFGILTALFLTPYNAQTIVPLVTYSPLVPMFIFILGAPFKYFLIAQDPDAKAGFRWLFALIGVELAIGVYFAVVPVSNDPGLTPLLILGATALFFLTLGQITRWLRILLIVLLVAITVIFIGGGRRKMEAALAPTHEAPAAQVAPRQSPLTQPASVPATSASARQRPAGGEFCSDAAPLDYTDFQGNQLTLDMRPDCFSGFVSLPTAWRGAWQAVPAGDAQGYWISLWFDGLAKPDGPFGPNDGSQLTNRLTPFRLKGSGRVMFYPGTASTPPPITSGPVAVVQDIDNYEFGFWPCRRVAAALHCAGYVKNEYTQAETVWLTLSGIRDDAGNRYQAQSWSVNVFNCGTSSCYATLQPHASQSLSLKVDGVVSTARSLTLTFHLTNGSRQSLGDVTIVIPIATLS